jgi:hypothetical protein
MEWRCRECGRTYDEPPETCVCGSPDVGPREDEPSRFSLLALRKRLLDPGDADRSLVRDEPYVALAFRLLLAAVVVGVALIALALLV